MVDFQIKKFIGLGSACKSVFKNIGSMLFNVPKRILKAAFRIPMEIAYLPFRVINRIFRLIFKGKKSSDTPCNCSVKKSSETEPVKSSETEPVKSSETEQEKLADVVPSEGRKDVIEGVKKMRNNALQTIDRMTGAQYIRQSAEVKKRVEKLIEALNIEYDPRPAVKSLKSLQTKEEKFSNDSNTTPKKVLTESVPEIIQALNDIGSQVKPNDDASTNLGKSKLGNVRACINCLRRDSPVENVSPHSEEVFGLSIEILHSLVNIVTQEIVLLKRRLSSTNNKMEEVLKSSGNLFDELSKLNEQFNQLSGLSTKITDLQHELGEGRQLLQAVETDRNEMQRKLLALERMIKEEEEYLDDVSCESGYDELELAASPCSDDL